MFGTMVASDLMGLLFGLPTRLMTDSFEKNVKNTIYELMRFICHDFESGP